MAQLRGRNEVERRKQRLVTTVDQVTGASLSPELLAHYSRYICVLLSGHAEQSIKELALQYARKRSDPRLQRFAGTQLKRLRNIDKEKLRQLVHSFDPLWWDALAAARPDELDAFDSVATIRNSVSHGGDSGITLALVEQYMHQVNAVLADLCDLWDPL